MLSWDLIGAEPAASCRGWVRTLPIRGGSGMVSWLAALPASDLSMHGRGASFLERSLAVV